MTLLPIFLAVGLLILLVAFGKVHPFIAFIVAALSAALMMQMPIDVIIKTMEKGIGEMLGSLAITIIVGAMFGKIIADSGAAQKIAESLMTAFGLPLLGLAMAATGLIVGIPLYYNVGFVIMVPLIFSVAQRTKLPIIYVGLPLLAGLSIAHGFLPPHPSPQALVNAFGADTGLTLIYGLIIAVPTLLIAGPLFALSLKKIDAKPVGMFAVSDLSKDELPSGFMAFFIALLPVLLIGLLTAITFWTAVPEPLKPWMSFVSNPATVLLVSLAAAVATLGLKNGQKFAPLMESLGNAIKDISPILMIIGGAGALKAVLVESGVSQEIGNLLQTVPVNMLVLSWLIAAVIRVLLGSATVAGLTTVGILAPLVPASGADPNLVVLAVGAGSLMCSHVNDSGFWMYKEYFNLSLKDTFRSWTVMETLVGSFGLLFVLLLDNFI